MDDDSQQLMTLSSRERLLLAAIRLFAAKGYRHTTVGDIEEAAGFTARGGALYKHFPGKQALLEAAVDRHVERIAKLGQATAHLPLGDDGADLVLLLRTFLYELDEERAVTAILEKEGERFPVLRDRFYREVIEPGMRDTVTLIERIMGTGTWDVEVIAVIVIGAIVNHRRTAWTFGSAPLDVSDDRLIETLRDLVRWVVDPSIAVGRRAKPAQKRTRRK